MSNDKFAQVMFTPGQEVRSQDLLDSQVEGWRTLFDQLLGRLACDRAVPPFVGIGPRIFCPTIHGGRPCRGSTDAKVGVTPGTIYMWLADGNFDDEAALKGLGSEDYPVFIPYTFDGSEEVTIAAGDAGGSRLDVVQVKLELYDSTDNEDRVFSTEAVAAQLDTSGDWTNLDTVFRARVRGAGGNNIRLRTVAGGALAYAESGNSITITFVDGVTTVADVEAIVESDSSLIEIEATGTGANILADPDDVVDYISFSGGVNNLLLSDSLPTRRRVKMTLSVKQGAVGDPLPYPDDGYAVLAMVHVPQNWAAGDKMSYWMEELDTSTDVAIIQDHRFPLKLRSYIVPARQAHRNSAGWEDNGVVAQGLRLRRTSGDDTEDNLAIFECPQSVGRLIGVDVTFELEAPGTQTVTLSVTPFFTPGGAISRGFSTVLGAPPYADKSGGDDINAQTVDGAGVQLTFQNPVWCNGGRTQIKSRRYGTPANINPAVYAFRNGFGAIDNTISYNWGLAATLESNAEGAVVSAVTFHVLEGLAEGNMFDETNFPWSRDQ